MHYFQGSRALRPPGAFQITMNEAYNTMHANVLPFYTPFTPVWGQKVKTFFLRKVVLHITLCN